MSLSIHRRADLQPDQVSKLEQALAAYYMKPPPSYYATANRAAANYTEELQPFHCDLVRRIQPGMNCLELGCGTAHLCPHIEARGAAYTGLDNSADLLAQNRKDFPRARFFPATTDIREQFDFVASLYTIEHVVDPPNYLERLWSLCKPGGLIAIICPDFIDGGGLPPSIFYGRTPRRLRQKLGSLSLADALSHLRELWLDGPLWLRQAQAAPLGAFWMNLFPRNLHDNHYSIDSDAVHLARLKDLVWWLEQKGGTILATSRTLPNIRPEILRFNCYVIGQKTVELE